MVDLAGSTIQTAKSIALSAIATTLRDRVGSSDIDMFRFKFSQRSRLTVQLEGLTANANLELGQDLNHNNQLDAGEWVASSRSPGKTADSISITGLDAGTYFLRVVPGSSSTTPYTLKLSAQATGSVSFEYSLVQLTNQFRKSHGLPALAMNTQLGQSALKHSRSMALNDFFDHQGMDGSTPWDRIRAAGYDYVSAAENIAAGYTSPASVLKGWIDSPTHRANLLNSRVTELGIGFLQLDNDPGKLGYLRYWTQNFGSPKVSLIHAS